MDNWSTIISSIFIAIVLSLLPLPDWTAWLRPAWVLLVVIYWTMHSPYRVNVGWAWALGLLMDLLTGTLIGEHALGYTIICYAVSRMYIRLRMYPLIQQSLSVFFFVLAYQFTLYCIQGFIGELPNSQLFWLSSVTSMLLWPWLFVLLRDWRRWLKLA